MPLWYRALSLPRSASRHGRWGKYGRGFYYERMAGDIKKLTGATAPVTPQSLPQKDLTQKDLALLVCPVCRSALVLEALAAALPKVRCTACAREYPVADGIPILLPGRASPMGEIPSFHVERTAGIRNT